MTAARIVAASPEAVAEAARIVRAGGIVAFPTETVYGLGADASNERAVAAIFAAKDRPRFNPLICHVPDAARAAPLVDLDHRAHALAARFWPGPLTLVCARREGAPLALLATAGLDTVAVRAPDHPLAQALLAAAGVPIAAPSANRSGLLSPTAAAHVAAGLGRRVPLILDGGPCRVGLESTIIDLSGPRPVLLRPGGVSLEAIEAVVGPVEAKSSVAGGEETVVRAPGMLSRHYAPARPLRLDAAKKRPGEAFLAFGSTGGADADLNLSVRGDLAEAAANLFAMLRALDRGEAAAIAVAPVPETGLGRAINDRLRRAAAPAPRAASVTDTGTGAGADDWDDERGPAAPCVLPDLPDEHPDRDD